jgi:hypothetical protein
MHPFLSEELARIHAEALREEIAGRRAHRYPPANRRSGRRRSGRRPERASGPFNTVATLASRLVGRSSPRPAKPEST